MSREDLLELVVEFCSLVGRERTRLPVGSSDDVVEGGRDLDRSLRSEGLAPQKSTLNVLNGQDITKARVRRVEPYFLASS